MIIRRSSKVCKFILNSSWYEACIGSLPVWEKVPPAPSQAVIAYNRYRLAEPSLDELIDERARPCGPKILSNGPQSMNLADHIFAKRVLSADPAWIADILARLIWLTEDNGKEIADSLPRWLTENDQLKVQIAMHVGEVWLWETSGEMDGILGSVAARFPSPSEICTKRRLEWNNQFPSC